MTEVPMQTNYDFSEGPLELVGHTWRLLDEKSWTWQRLLFRRHRSGRVVVSPLVHVDASRDFCMRCLSNEVVRFRTFLTGDLKGALQKDRLRCRGCGLEWHYVDE